MSDLLIKNIEIPFCCDKCFYVKKCFAHEVKLRKLAESEYEQIFDVFGEMRLDDCPLVVLSPHGRLVDVDFIKSCMEEIKKSYPNVYELIVGILDRTPTVLEASTEGR